MKKFTVGELFDAIEKNGLPKAHGWFFRSNTGLTDLPENIYGKIGAACALGQAVINLGVKPTSHHSEWIWKSYSLRSRLGPRITSLNDHTDGSFKEIADTLREEFKNDLEEVIEAPEFDYSPYL